MINFKNPVVLSGQQDQALKKPARAFGVVFNRSKYVSDVLNAHDEVKKGLVVAVRPPVGYCSILTNFTSISLPLYAYDGLLSFVRTALRCFIRQSPVRSLGSTLFLDSRASMKTP